MASAGGDTGGGQPTEAAAERRGAGDRASDRHAEALRANLKRRKAQIRARAEVRPGDPPTPPEPDSPAADA